MAFGKTKHPLDSHALPLFTIMPDGELWRAAVFDGSELRPLVSPYGDKYEKRTAAREASNALYRHLCLGLTERSSASAIVPGLSPEFKITGR